MSDTDRQIVKPNTRTYILGLTFCWLILFLLILRNSFLAGWPVILFWGALVFVIESLYVKLKKGASSSATFAVIFAAILLFGPLTAGIIALFEAITWREIINIKRAHPLKWLFNGVSQSFCSLLSGITYQALGGLIFFKAHNGFTLSNFPSQVMPLIFSIAVYYLLNTLLVSLVISLNEDVTLKNLWTSIFIWGDLSYLALGFMGIIFAQIYHFERFALILLISPLAIARQTFSRYMELEEAYSSTIGALVKAIEAKDPYTKGHSERVANLSTEIGRKLNLSEKQIEDLKRISALHDVGKIGVPKRILLKPEDLTEQEFHSIKEHPRIGARILKDVHFLKDLIPAVYYHHEKIDGSGYNSGLTGRSIPLFARIIALADSYDAMTSDRAYRKALSKEAVIDQLTANAGTQFDSKIVEALLSIDGEIKPKSQKRESLQAATT